MYFAFNIGYTNQSLKAFSHFCIKPGIGIAVVLSEMDDIEQTNNENSGRNEINDIVISNS